MFVHTFFCQLYILIQFGGVIVQEACIYTYTIQHFGHVLLHHQWLESFLQLQRYISIFSSILF